MASRNKWPNKTPIKKSLTGGTFQDVSRDVSETWQEFLLRVCGINLMRCPFCGKGKMVRKAVLLPERYKEPP